MKRILFALGLILSIHPKSWATYTILRDASNITRGTLATARLDSTTVMLVDGGTRTVTGQMNVYLLSVGNTTGVPGAYFEVGEGSTAWPTGGPSTIIIKRNKQGGGISLLQFDNGVTNGACTIQGRLGGSVLDFTCGQPAASAVVVTVKSTNVIITGDLTVTGTFAATSKAFKIPHPTKSGKWLYHAAIESDKYGLMYDGTAQLSGGATTITLPDYFELVAAATGRTVQLTCIDDSSPLYIEGGISSGQFTVKTKPGGNFSQKFHWLVTAKRGDVAVGGDLQVEQDIPDSDLNLEAEDDGTLTNQQMKINAMKRLRSKYKGYEVEGKNLPKLKK